MRAFHSDERLLGSCYCVCVCASLLAWLIYWDVWYPAKSKFFSRVLFPSMTSQNVRRDKRYVGPENHKIKMAAWIHEDRVVQIGASAVGRGPSRHRALPPRGSIAQCKGWSQPDPHFPDRLSENQESEELRSHRGAPEVSWHKQSTSQPLCACVTGM